MGRIRLFPLLFQNGWSRGIAGSWEKNSSYSDDVNAIDVIRFLEFPSVKFPNILHRSCSLLAFLPLNLLKKLLDQAFA